MSCGTYAVPCSIVAYMNVHYMWNAVIVTNCIWGYIEHILFTQRADCVALSLGLYRIFPLYSLRLELLGRIIYYYYWNRTQSTQIGLHLFVFGQRVCADHKWIVELYANSLHTQQTLEIACRMARSVQECDFFQQWQFFILILYLNF